MSEVPLCAPSSSADDAEEKDEGDQESRETLTRGRLLSLYKIFEGFAPGCPHAGCHSGRPPLRLDEPAAGIEGTQRKDHILLNNSFKSALLPRALQ